MHSALAEKRDALVALCRRLGVRRLDVFGSAVRDDFDPARSDADFLIEFAPEARAQIASYMAVKEALELVLGRRVDLIERQTIEASRNYIRRRRILNEAEAIYVA
jgi:predicted nucleotidyltransferase